MLSVNTYTENRLAAAIILSIAVFVLPAFFHQLHATEKKQCLAPANIFQHADDPQTEAALISSDLLLFGAAMAQRTAIDAVAENTIEKTQKALIDGFLKALEERLYAWRNSDEALNAALGDLISEFAVMHRFYEPQDEYKLFYEKSVHIRMNTFENQRQNALLKRSDFLSTLLPQEDGTPGEKARMYAGENPLLLEDGNDRMAALLIMHILQTTPQLKKIWLTYQKQALSLFSDSFNTWKKIEKAAEHLPLGRDSDLCDSEIRTAFKDRLQTIFGNFSSFSGRQKEIPLSLLAMRSADFRNTKTEEEPEEQQILSFIAKKQPVSDSAKNLQMSLFCVEHGKAEMLNRSSAVILNKAYVETAPQQYKQAAANLEATARIVADSGPEFSTQAGMLLEFASELRNISELRAIYGDGAVQIAPAPQTLISNKSLRSALSGSRNFSCIYGVKHENTYTAIRGGQPTWVEQKIEYLLPLEEAPELEGNAMLEEAPALVIPDSRSLISLIAPRLAYMRQIEKIADANGTVNDIWQEFPFGAPSNEIHQQN